MTRPRIEPRFGDAPKPSDDPERFVVEPRPERQAARKSVSKPVRDAAGRDSLKTPRRISWVLALLGLVVLAGAVLRSQDDQAGLTGIAGFMEQLRGSLQGVMPGRAGHQTPAGRAESADGRALNRACEDWRQAFVANPLPATREEMLRQCQAYERYLATGQVPAAEQTP